MRLPQSLCADHKHSWVAAALLTTSISVPDLDSLGPKLKKMLQMAKDKSKFSTTKKPQPLWRPQAQLATALLSTLDGLGPKLKKMLQKTPKKCEFQKPKNSVCLSGPQAHLAQLPI